MNNYNLWYSRPDSSLLSDFFRILETRVMAYELDPLYFSTSLELSSEALLKCTKAELEVFFRRSRYAFYGFQGGTSWGVSMITHQYATDNNLHNPEPYEQHQPHTQLI